MPLEHERNDGLGMDALVGVMLLQHKRNYGLHGCSGQRDALGTRMELGFGHGCSGQHDALGTRMELGFGHGCSGRREALGARTEFWFGHGCSGQRMLSEPERKYGLGMDALVNVTLLEVSYRNARYTVSVSESRLPDESKLSAF